jgi:phosphomannomutase
MTLPDALKQQVRDWMADDPDPDTRAELETLLAQADDSEIEERFGGPLEFGTAGLRGLLGAGPNRMNRVVVARATAGLCHYLLEHVPGAAERGLCIGFDGRTMSREFARDVAEIVAGAGIRALAFDHVVPTPLLAFAAKHTGAAAAVMVTASHNPPAYNGYKVYWENGAQIIPPHDHGIAQAIDAVGPVSKLPRLDREAAKAEGLFEVLGPNVERHYLDGVHKLLPNLSTSRRGLRIAYTALHGVGQPYVLEALEEAGFDDVFPVQEQADPDPAFPTVDFPNPEEKGAMDRVLALAKTKEADLVLANDPDADRLAVAARRSDGEHEMLTGNDLGCLLAHYLLEHSEGPDRAVISTIVSSPLLGEIARAHRAHFEQTLTGFKRIANRAIELEQDRRLQFVMGYEEALGYSVGTLVRDKDGVSAAAVVADLAAHCRAEGRTILDELERCWRRYGMYLSRQISVVHEGRGGAERIRALMDKARRKTPRTIAELDVIAVQDLGEGVRKPSDGSTEPLGLPRTNLVLLELEGGHRAMLRPSGTEPKLKYYVDVRVDVDDVEAIGDARQRGSELIDRIAADLRAQLE